MRSLKRTEWYKNQKDWTYNNPQAQFLRKMEELKMRNELAAGMMELQRLTRYGDLGITEASLDNPNGYDPETDSLES